MYLQVPPHVEYAPTPLGQTLGALVCAICDWVAAHYGESEAARRAYDAQQQGTNKR
jgi:DNA-binding HxlR family transcriptional regulator